METFVQFAIANSLDSYGISSHAPVPFPNNWSMKQDDMDEYVQEYMRLKEKYRKEIDLYLGLEVDYIPRVASVYDKEIASRRWDYLIGSIHHIDATDDGAPWNIDGNLKTFKKGLQQIFGNDITAATKRFYQYTNEMIERGGFDIIGHFDKIHLNGRFIDGFDTDSTWYQRLINETIELIAQKGIIVEINTKSYLEKGITFPDSKTWGLLLKKSIPIMVNSDCHYPDLITAGFQPVYQALKDVGFTSTMKRKGNEWKEDPIQ